MTDLNIPQEMRELIAQNKLMEATQLLSCTELKNEGIGFEGRLTDLAKEIRAHKIQKEQVDLEKNRIRHSLLEIADLLEGKKKAKGNFRQILVRLGILIVLSIVALGEFKNSNWFQSVPAHLFTDESAYHILLLPFGPDGVCALEQNQYHWQVQKRLLELNIKDNLGIEVKRQDTIMCDIIDVESVKAYGEEMDADLVIYGNYQERCEWDTTLLKIRYLSLDSFVEIGEASMFKEGETEYAIEDKKSLIELRSGNLTGTVEDIIYWALSIRTFLKGDYQETVDKLGRIQSQEKSEFAIMWAVKAHAYYRLGQDSLALAFYSNAIKLNPTDAIAYNNRGFIYRMLQDYDLALSDYDKSIELDPNDAITYNNRGVIYNKQKEYDLAIISFNKSIELNPQYPIAYNNRGNTYRHLKKFDLAKKDVVFSQKLNPNYGSPYATHAMIYADEGDIEKFYENLEKAIQEDRNPIYPLKEKILENETLQRFKDEPRFQKLMERSKK